jgi:NAD(P)-dependent dehydrogenase (short-subunit alcohol dehydrogenase family)
MRLTARVIDAALEASVVGSFTRVGYDARRRLDRWEAPPARLGATALVTGATSGIGYEVALALASLGASVRFVARSEDRARRARDEIVARSGNADVDFTLADMADLASVRDVADWIGDTFEVLDVLVHNAGAIAPTRTLTHEGTEVTAASQLLGPFLLTGWLLGLLSRSGPGRVITVSSGGMYTQRFELADLEMDAAHYDGVTQYARVKRAQVVLTHEWARRTDPHEVVFHAMHPGWVDTPGVRASLPGFYRVTRRLLRSPAEGADTIVWLANARESLAPSGAFWLDRRRRLENKVPWTRSRDPLGDQARLWEWCAQRSAWALATGGEGRLDDPGA